MLCMSYRLHKNVDSMRRVRFVSLGHARRILIWRLLEKQIERNCGEMSFAGGQGAGDCFMLTSLSVSFK